MEDIILEGWKDGEYYLDGKKLSGGLGSIVKASAYVQDGAEWAEDSGLYNALASLGLSIAGVRTGSTSAKKFSGITLSKLDKKLIEKLEKKWYKSFKRRGNKNKRIVR